MKNNEVGNERHMHDIDKYDCTKKNKFFSFITQTTLSFFYYEKLHSFCF